MNPLEGAWDPMVQRFWPYAAATLLGAAIILLAVTPLLRQRKAALLREVWLRWAMWVTISALLLAALAAGRLAWVVVIGILTLFVFREYSRAVGLWQDWGLQAVVYVFIGLFTVTAWGYVLESDPEPGSYGLFIVLPVWATVFLLAVPVVRGGFENMLQRLALAIVALVYLVFFLEHYAFMVNLPGGFGLVLFVSFLVAVNDVSAFVVGKLAGRHALRRNLSPGKTWEGAAGALVAVLAVAWLLRWLVPSVPTMHVGIMAILVAVCGVFGDLVTSVIKRDLGIKDWSTALPGHGGLLDRTNSLIFAAPVLFHYYRFFFV